MSGQATGGLATDPAPKACRILIVDDHPDTARSYSELLSVMGHRCEYTSDPGAVMTMARSLSPQLALLDIGLTPDIDGHLLAKLLRHAFGTQITIVAVTAYGRDEDRRRTREAGFDAHVTKPMDMHLLESIVDTACRPD